MEERSRAAAYVVCCAGQAVGREHVNTPANSTMCAATYTTSFLSRHHDPYLSSLGLLHTA